MVTVFISHSSRDKAFVRSLADFLSQDGLIQPWLDEREIAPGQNIVSRISQGLASEFMLLILSPDSINSNWVREEWTDACWEQTNDRRTRLIAILYRDCMIPPLIRNKKYFDLRKNQQQGFREIKHFLLTQQLLQPSSMNQLPQRPPIFVGRESELVALHAILSAPGTLVQVCGRPGQGKSAFALEFAHRYERNFDAVYWLACGGRSLPAITTDLARFIGQRPDGHIDEIVSDLKDICARKRCLLIFDNVIGEEAGKLIPGGTSSVLVTTQVSNLSFLRFIHSVPLPLFTEEQCFQLFNHVLGARDVDLVHEDCSSLFQKVGYLPLGVSLCAALIRYDVRFTISKLVANLPADLTAVIHEAINAVAPASQRLVSAMAACAPEGYRLGLAAALADLNEATALDALQELSSRCLVEEIDRSSRHYRLHALIRLAARTSYFVNRHSEAIQKQFETWETNWELCAIDLPDFKVALDRALSYSETSNTRDAAHELATLGFFLTRRIGRLTECFETSQRLISATQEHGNREALCKWLTRSAGVLSLWGRQEEALALLTRAEALLVELGGDYALAPIYGNHAVILRKLGRLDEALNLHKLEEQILLALPDKDGLSRSYSNQAAVLIGQGQTHEALALLESQEAICLEIGNKDHLVVGYGNRVPLLLELGRFEEALTLLEKSEKLCLELGNKESLAYCHYRWGQLARAKNDADEEQRKLLSALTLFIELQMQDESNAVAKQLADIKTKK